MFLKQLVFFKIRFISLRFIGKLSKGKQILLVFIKYVSAEIDKVLSSALRETEGAIEHYGNLAKTAPELVEQLTQLKSNTQQINIKLNR